MVSTHHTEGVASVWRPPLEIEYPKRHWRTPRYDLYSNGSPEPEEDQSYSQILPVSVAQPPQAAHQNYSPCLEPAPQLHEALHGLRMHKIAWDISESPLMARCITSRGVSEPIPASILCQSATRPAVRNMRILCESFPWDIRIHIPQSEQDKVITVGLVLEAIHGVMQEDLDVEDWERKSSTLKKKIHTEMCARLCKAEPSIEANVRVLKIDCLLGRTEFMGLDSVGQSGDANLWLLSFGPP